MTGINVINYYQTIMYETLGITGKTNILVTGIYNCLGPLANLLFILFVLDKVGRRKPMMFGAIGITIALFCEAALNSQNEDGTRRGYSIGGVFFIFCVTIIFSWSFGPCSWYVMLYLLKGPQLTNTAGSTWPKSCQCKSVVVETPLLQV